MELEKKQWSGFCQTHKFKCEQAQRRALLSSRGAKAKECMKDSRPLQTVSCKLDFMFSCSAGGSDLTWAAPSEAWVCVYDCLWGRNGRNGKRLGHLRVSWWGMWGEWDGDPTKQDWRGDLNELRCTGWVTYVWRLEAANLIHSHLCIFHLFFRMHRRSEI